jgi:sorbitol-6-phosphate 2-dehydrogenase
MRSELVLPYLRVLLGKDGVPALIRAESLPSWKGAPEEEARRLSAGLPEGIAHWVPSLSGRLAGRVAFVTGAAQGFGLGIAQDLAAEGALVTLADRNLEGAEAAASALNKTHPGQAFAVALDVTDEESVASSMATSVRFWGGMDLLVSNAGVLKAESVLTQSAEDFDFVTKVNYRGYFLCVKHAAPYLEAAHRADPTQWKDIIQINSKSGLQGSNRNGAYAGSKFGGIGLTQSFALELLEKGIKVNSVCPGNYFEGPLWMDPETGLFAQYLRSGKVPGAKTLEEVRSFYESKIPMGRGCQVADVVKAILYLVEQCYETGQALPVTGGQVMLS